jgi:hypothetical protein
MLYNPPSASTIFSSLNVAPSIVRRELKKSMQEMWVVFMVHYQSFIYDVTTVTSSGNHLSGIIGY